MLQPNPLNHSYWEVKQYFGKFDLIVIGGGIVGLSAAISFKMKNRKAEVLILERGLLPAGASTKNAGFACFGSAGEILDDLKTMDENVVWDTVKMRWQGLQLLRKRLGDKSIQFKQHGGYELFDSQSKFESCCEEIEELNKKIEQLLGLKKCFKISNKQNNFNNCYGALLNSYEGEIDSGFMMQRLLQLAHLCGVKILNGIAVSQINDNLENVCLNSNYGQFTAAKVIVATNGFASELLQLPDIKPARAQVLITKPIIDLKLKGTYHFDRGYYYFRNIKGRILLGGGRNLDFITETTTDGSLNTKIQKSLDALLRNMILPNVDYEIDMRWTGIMGVGSEKKPIIRHVSKKVLAAVRMGGMGIAIGSWVGEKAAEEVR
jgi:glycine/D-amino acid oxidase-like deaminating enzyme